MPIFLPPLRERIEDIPEIARHLLTPRSATTRTRKLSLTDMAQRRLANHEWPGNVRELETVWSALPCFPKTARSMST